MRPSSTERRRAGRRAGQTGGRARRAIAPSRVLSSPPLNGPRAAHQSRFYLYFSCRDASRARPAVRAEDGRTIRGTLHHPTRVTFEHGEAKMIDSDLDLMSP